VFNAAGAGLFQISTARRNVASAETTFQFLRWLTVIIVILTEEGETIGP